MSPQPRGGAARAADQSDDACRDPQGGPRPEPFRQPVDEPPPERRHRLDGPLGGQLACPYDDRVIGLAFGPEEPHYGCYRRQPDRTIAQALRAQPVLVELEPLGQPVDNRLMEAGPDEPAHAHLCHDRPVTDPGTTAAIVAGGRASRFGGRDKSRLIVEGRSIIFRQVDVLQRVAAEVMVIGPDPARFADLGLAGYPDRQPGLGALGGVSTALEVARFDRVIVVACDLPFLDEGLLRRLVTLADGAVDGAWVHGPRGVEPLLACYRRTARDAVRQQIAAGRLQLAALGSVLRMAEVTEPELRTYGSPDRLLANLNSPADYARVQYRPS